MVPKFIYIITIILCIAAGILSVALFSRETKELEAIGSDDIYEIYTPVTTNISVNIPVTPPISAMVDKNLFDPLRGKKKQDTSVTNGPILSTKTQGFKLHGVFLYGDSRGAIISGEEIKGSKVFRQDEALGNGYFIKKIEKDEVVITGGGAEITLQFEKTPSPTTPKNVNSSIKSGRQP